jgi:hypothetical protein
MGWVLVLLVQNQIDRYNYISMTKQPKLTSMGIVAESPKSNISEGQQEVLEYTPGSIVWTGSIESSVDILRQFQVCISAEGVTRYVLHTLAHHHQLTCQCILSPRPQDRQNSNNKLFSTSCPMGYLQENRTHRIPCLHKSGANAEPLSTSGQHGTADPGRRNQNCILNNQPNIPSIWQGCKRDLMGRWEIAQDTAWVAGSYTSGRYTPYMGSNAG